MAELEKTLTGFIKFRELRDLIHKYYIKAPSGAKLTPDKELIFHNYTDEEHWVVVPVTFDLLRSVSRPLLYSYSIQLIAIRKADTPADAITDTNLKAAVAKFDLRRL